MGRSPGRRTIWPPRGPQRWLLQRAPQHLRTGGRPRAPARFQRPPSPSLRTGGRQLPGGAGHSSPMPPPMGRSPGRRMISLPCKPQRWLLQRAPQHLRTGGRPRAPARFQRPPSPSLRTGGRQLPGGAGHSSRMPPPMGRSSGRRMIWPRDSDDISICGLSCSTSHSGGLPSTYALAGDPVRQRVFNAPRAPAYAPAGGSCPGARVTPRECRPRWGATRAGG